MVRIPRCFRRPSRVMLKSGASMPTKTSGFNAVNRWVRSLRIFNKRGRRSRTSTTPMTANSSISYQASHPSACISGPATPTKRASGWCFFSARIKPAPRISPDVSPATRPIVRKGFCIIYRLFAEEIIYRMTSLSADDAACRTGKEITKRFNCRELCGNFSDFWLGFFQRFATTVQDLVCITDSVQCRLVETATLKPFDIDTKWRGVVALSNDKRWNILSNARTPTDHHMRTNDAELMYGRHTTNDGVIVNLNVTTQGRVIGQDTTISNDTILGNMCVNH